jgi:hypothetical protein
VKFRTTDDVHPIEILDPPCVDGQFILLGERS